MTTETTTNTETTSFAWVRLSRLCGCNYRMPIRRGGKSVFVTDPQGTHQYRLSASAFDAGQKQFRDSWCIERWSERAERITESERNWQS